MEYRVIDESRAPLSPRHAYERCKRVFLASRIALQVTHEALRDLDPHALYWWSSHDGHIAILARIGVVETTPTHYRIMVPPPEGKRDPEELCVPRQALDTTGNVKAGWRRCAFGRYLQPRLRAQVEKYSGMVARDEAAYQRAAAAMGAEV